MLAYSIRLKKDDNGTILATAPDFPELTTFGEDRDDALLHAIDALEEAIAARIARDQDIPLLSMGRNPVALPTLSSIKVLLYRAMREESVRKAELARRLGWHAPQVDRLFDLTHASRIDQLDRAFSALGRRLNVTANADRR